MIQERRRSQLLDKYKKERKEQRRKRRRRRGERERDQRKSAEERTDTSHSAVRVSNILAPTNEKAGKGGKRQRKRK